MGVLSTPDDWRHYGFTFENSVGVCTKNTDNISVVRFSPGGYVSCLSYAPTASDYSHTAILMTVNDWKHFGLTMCQCTNLKAIDFPSCGLSGEDVSEFLGNGMRGCPLEYLDLRSNALGARGIDAILRLLLSRQVLNYLDLSQTRMDDDAARKLSKGLNHCRIKDLSLEWNRIGDDGLKSLLSSTNADYLGTLELRGNNAGQQWMEIMCRFLQKGNVQLQSLSLECVTVEWVVLLLSAISKNTSLQFCHISGLAAGRAGMEKIKTVLSELVLNTSSLDSLLKSNHTFHFLSCVRPDEFLDAALRINSRRNLSNDEKLRRKFRLLFTKDVDLNPLMTVKPALVPYLLQMLNKPGGLVLPNREKILDKIFRFISKWYFCRFK